MSKSKETYCWSIDNTDYHFYFRTVAEATAVPEAAVMKTLLVMTQNGMFNNSACVFDQTIQFEQQVDRKNDKQTPILLKRGYPTLNIKRLCSFSTGMHVA